MINLGFIGYGKMGSVLLNSLLTSGAAKEIEIYVITRTIQKLNTLKTQYPSITIVDNIRQIVEKCKTIFICVGTLDVKTIIDQISLVSSPDLHLILISGGLEIATVEKAINCKITRIMPTMLAQIGEGVTLITHNKKVEGKDRNFICDLLKKIGDIYELEESEINVGTNLTSCAPAFIAYLLDQYVRSIIRNSNLPYKEAFDLFKSTVTGTLKLLEKNGETTSELIDRVATKGGATEEGIKVLSEKLPEAFDQLLSATMERHLARSEATQKQFFRLREDASADRPKQ